MTFAPVPALSSSSEIMFAAIRNVARLLPTAPRPSMPGPSMLMCALGAVRHKYAGGQNAVWWQPMLPALAPQLVPNTPGKGNRKKKMQQRRAQSVTMQARRIEGNRRASIFRKLKNEEHHDKVKDIYRQYAEMLRAKAGAGAAPTSTTGEKSGSAQPTS